MVIWELFYDGLNEHAVFVSDEGPGNMLGTFAPNGKPKDWAVPPRIKPFIEKRRKKAKPRADLSYLIAGSITLNEKAYQALKDFLLPFGQLLELNCEGGIEYYYNVTNLVPCIDYERSVKTGTSVIKAVFLPDAVPEAPLIFKDPYTAGTRIYLNQAGKEKFEKLCADAGLFGARFVEAGQGLI
jgi:hypothetical protein